MNLDKFPFVGDFRELEHGRPDGPSLRAAVRDTEPEYGRDLVRYLRSGSALIATPSAVPDVLSPSGAVIGGLHLLTDGQWLWYSDLAYYVEHYRVTLDPWFIEHARNNDWMVPELSDSDLDAMLTVLIKDDSD
ncbi:hypothetical protein [Kitasatospora aureofaciens]|uniref:hypothetical protein n=1 Tax=Kitasatospora aureofaciens TaxID=1894 RepID=UPI0005245AE3|nr:hypothetical protein [Kitasatospora aureofaciens]HJD80682.1 hypothetical protein [Kitasatospora aureofaciens]